MSGTGNTIFSEKLALLAAGTLTVEQANDGRLEVMQRQAILHALAGQVAATSGGGVDTDDDVPAIQNNTAAITQQTTDLLTRLNGLEDAVVGIDSQSLTDLYNQLVLLLTNTQTTATNTGLTVQGVADTIIELQQLDVSLAAIELAVTDADIQAQTDAAVIQASLVDIRSDLGILISEIQVNYTYQATIIRSAEGTPYIYHIWSQGTTPTFNMVSDGFGGFYPELANTLGVVVTETDGVTIQDPSGIVYEESIAEPITTDYYYVDGVNQGEVVTKRLVTVASGGGTDEPFVTRIDWIDSTGSLVLPAPTNVIPVGQEPRYVYRPFVRTVNASNSQTTVNTITISPSLITSSLAEINSFIGGLVGDLSIHVYSSVNISSVRVQFSNTSTNSVSLTDKIVNLPSQADGNIDLTNINIIAEKTDPNLTASIQVEFVGSTRRLP